MPSLTSCPLKVEAASRFLGQRPLQGAGGVGRLCHHFFYIKPFNFVQIKLYQILPMKHSNGISQDKSILNASHRESVRAADDAYDGIVAAEVKCPCMRAVHRS